MPDYISVYAKLPDGRTFFMDYPTKSVTLKKYDLSSIADSAIRHFGIKSSRSQNEHIMVEVGKTDINSRGVVVLTRLQDILSYPPLEPLTGESYCEELERLLHNVPQEFHSFITSYAYEKGHAYGYDECLSIAKDLVDELIPSINQFAENRGLKLSNGKLNYC